MYFPLVHQSRSSESTSSGSALSRDCDASAWAEFVRRLDPLIRSVVLRLCRRLNLSGSEQAEDLIQETYVRICAEDCRVLREFEWSDGEHFNAYIRVVTANVVRDSAKARFAVKRGRQITDPLKLYCTPALQDHPGELERDILLGQIYAAARQVSGARRSNAICSCFGCITGWGSKE